MDFSVQPPANGGTFGSVARKCIWAGATHIPRPCNSHNQEQTMIITLQETPALRLHPDDDVAIALLPLAPGRKVEVAGQRVRLNAEVGPGHKLALRPIEAGQPVYRYGQMIGFATRPI